MSSMMGGEVAPECGDGASLPKKPAVAKASAGAGTSAPDWEHDLVDSGDDGSDAEDAEYTAELIRDAARDLNRSDRMSEYERRVALREIKMVLKDAYDDRGERPTNPKIREYMLKDEHTNTNEQFRLLREEMLRVAAETEAFSARISQMCHVIRSAWKSQQYRPTTDLFEIAVLRGGRRLNPNAETIRVLEALVSGYMVGHAEMSGPDNAVEVGQMRLRLRDILVACSIPESRAVAMCQEPSEGGPLAAAVARIDAVLPEYRRVLEKVQALREPGVLAITSAEDSDVKRPSVEVVEDFLERAAATLKLIKRWQHVAGAPFYVSKGEKLRFGVPAEHVGGTEPFSVILERCIAAAEKALPCKSFSWK